MTLDELNKLDRQAKRHESVADLHRRLEEKVRTLRRDDGRRAAVANRIVDDVLLSCLEARAGYDGGDTLGPVLKPILEECLIDVLRVAEMRLDAEARRHSARGRKLAAAVEDYVYSEQEGDEEA